MSDRVRDLVHDASVRGQVGERPERPITSGCFDGDPEPRSGTEDVREREQRDASFDELTCRQGSSVGFGIAVRRLERGRIIDAERSAGAVERLAQLPIARYPTGTLLDRAWALRQNFTEYDAMYVALAEALESPLVTADAHLARSVRDHSHAAVVLLSA